MNETSSQFVSIALCTYNGAEYLREQLDSLLAQTYSWHELIVVDDRSTDATWSILESYAQQEARIKIHQNANNIGPNKNFFKAMSLCAGDIIAPCDQDDIWLPSKLATLLAAIGTSSMTYCDSALISATGEPMGTSMSDRVNMISTNDPSCFLFLNCVSGHASILKSEVLQKAKETPEGFNYDWWLAAVAASINGVTFVNEALVKHRQHDNNTTNVFCESHPARKKIKLRGYKTLALWEAEKKIRALTKLPGSHQQFFARFHNLWCARYQQWICPRLAWIILRRGARLYAPQKEVSTLFLAKLVYSLFWGIKAKRLTNRYAYDTQISYASQE